MHEGLESYGGVARDSGVLGRVMVARDIFLALK